MSRCIANIIYLEKPKRSTIWNGGSSIIVLWKNGAQ
jgi:hypothetical protein